MTISHRAKNYYEKLHVALWHMDPGFFRLKQACKTILAVLMTLWFVRYENLVIKLMSALACGFSMQGIDAKRFSYRIMQAILFNLIYFLVFFAGLLVRDSAFLSACLLIVVGFTVNYGRRFYLENSIAPMMAWMLCFFATILPYYSTLEAWQHIYGLIIGLTVSAIVSTLILPDNHAKLFIRNTNQLFKLLAQGINGMRAYFHNHAKQAVDNYEFIKIKENLYSIINVNQSIDESNIFNDEQPWINKILFHEYILVSAYTMLVESYRSLEKYADQLSRSTLLALSALNKELADLLGAVQMVDHQFTRPKPSGLSLEKLDKSLSREHISEPMLIIALLNLKLIFTLIEQHVQALLRGK